MRYDICLHLTIDDYRPILNSYMYISYYKKKKPYIFHIEKKRNIKHKNKKCRERKKKRGCDKNYRIRFSHVRKSANVGRVDSLYLMEPIPKFQII